VDGFQLNPFWLLNLYIRALMKGNPFAVAIAIAGAVALGMGPFSDGIQNRDPVAITLMVLVVSLIAILIVVGAVVGAVDRKLNPPKPKPSSKPSPRGMAPAGRTGGARR